MKKRSSFMFVALVLILALLFQGCATRPKDTEPDSTPIPEAESTPLPASEETATPEPTPTATPEPTPEPTEEPKPEDLINPLTGEKTDRDFSMTRPVAVMLENNRIIGGPVIPMYGINDADILYEMQVEKITRTMGLYMDVSDVPQFCPVRSARTYFVSTALGYDALYVHRGASAEGTDWAVTMLAENFTSDNIDLGEDNSYNINSYPNTGEHSMCTSGELLTKHFETAGIRMEHETDDFDYGLHFREGVKAEGDPANTIRIVFPEYKITNMTYDAAKGGYTATNWDIPWADNNSGEVGVFQNVLILDTAISVGTDAKWHSSIAVNDCEGQGWFCCGGFYEPITWSRGGLNEPFHYFRADGSELELSVGRSYIGIISTALGGVTFG